MAERKRRRLTNRMQDGCAYVQSETGKEGVGHYTTQRRLPELITFTCKVEDIMEKYGIESFELLEHIIKKGMVINSVIEDFAKEAYDEMEQDRDTWKRACELACEREDDCYVYDNIHRAYEFYQQAKTEGNDDK